ncbi:unnamed protein product [Mytilus edulis]|uniref:Uncharacterized protein n=1 Tax=Mytilus edulis TaxID=6550 RepID=A0A8S3RI69_MYTED|nr:unnamed protein product [Mytilus edulis]
MQLPVQEQTLLRSSSKTLDELGYVNFIRNFFETSHAKGPQDAAGGLIKNQTDLAIVRGRATIQNARDLFEFAKSNLSVPKSSHCKRRLFKYTENINRNFRMFYKPITGIRSVHQVVVNNDHLLIRSLSCYTCNNCLEGNINECENTNILGSFSPIPIVPEIGTVDEDQTDENDMEVPINELISKSTIFAVLCDDDDFDYYLLKAQTETYQLTSRETDSWGVSYQPGTKTCEESSGNTIVNVPDYEVKSVFDSTTVKKETSQHSLHLEVKSLCLQAFHMLKMLLE